MKEHFFLYLAISVQLYLNMVQENCEFKTYFLNTDISLIFEVSDLTFLTGVDNLHMQGTVSQITDSGPSFHFMSKNG